MILGKLARKVEAAAPEGKAKHAVKVAENAKAGSFPARDNIANFISWARSLGIPDVVLFETVDLVEHKSEKNVLYRYVRETA